MAAFLFCWYCKCFCAWELFWLRETCRRLSRAANIPSRTIYEQQVFIFEVCGFIFEVCGFIFEMNSRFDFWSLWLYFWSLWTLIDWFGCLLLTGFGDFFGDFLGLLWDSGTKIFRHRQIWESERKVWVFLWFWVFFDPQIGEFWPDCQNKKCRRVSREHQNYVPTC